MPAARSTTDLLEWTWRRADRALSSAIDRTARFVLDRVDVTGYVIERVDLERVIAAVDLNSVLGRMDLAGLARKVIDEVELTNLIRDSTSTVASDGLVGIRLQGVAADERLNHLVDRVLRRRTDGRSPQAGVDRAADRAE